MVFIWSAFLAAMMFALAAMRHGDRFLALVMRRLPSTRECYAFFVAFPVMLVLRQFLTVGPLTATLAWFGAAGMALWIATFFRASAPTLVIAAGALSNLLVVAANGFTMPADMPVWDHAGYAPISAETRLWYLGDLFALQSSRGFGGYSIGDILMNIGFWWLNARLWLGIGGDNAARKKLTGLADNIEKGTIELTALRVDRE
jgi:hypothetical protein